MHYLSSVYFINQPLHVSGISAAHHQEVYCIYTTIGMCCSAQHVPIILHIQYTSWWWAADMPKTCRGWL